MEDPRDTLLELGLTVTEADIYLALLPQGAMTIQDIGKATRIKRPTIYHAVGTLLEKGLVSQKQDGNKSRFSAAEPGSLHALIELRRESLDSQAKKLERILPQLAAVQHEGAGDGVSIVQYAGIEGMKTVMDIAFFCRSKHWDIIAPYKNFLREYDADYAKRYLNARKYHGIVSRTLWEDAGGAGRKLEAEERGERNPRLMPWVMHGKFKSMMILFDDKIAIFSSLEKLSAVLITSRELHGMFAAMFEGLWEASEQY